MDRFFFYKKQSRAIPFFHRDERFAAEGERVLQIVAITSGYEQRSYVEPTRGTLLNLTGSDILDASPKPPLVIKNLLSLLTRSLHA